MGQADESVSTALFFSAGMEQKVSQGSFLKKLKAAARFLLQSAPHFLQHLHPL